MKKKNKKLKKIKYPILWVYRRFLIPQLVGVKNIVRIKQTRDYPRDAATVKINYLGENLIGCTVYIIIQSISPQGLLFSSRLLCHCNFQPTKQESFVYFNGVTTMVAQDDVNRILNEVHEKIALMGWGKFPDSADPTDSQLR